MPDLTARPSTDRVLAIDWLRGLSVLFMIECHALRLLEPARELDPLWSFLQSINGLVAPAFIMVAGFAFGLVSLRSAADPTERRRRRWRSLRRIGVVFGVALLLNFDYLWWEPRHLLHWGILQTIGMSLLWLWAMFLVLRLPRLAMAIVLPVLGAGSIFAGPFVQASDWGSFGYLLTNGEFRFIPWGGFAFLGAWIGMFCVGSHGRRGLYLTLLFVGAVAYAGSQAGPWLESWYPGGAWEIPNYAHRIVMICIVTLGLCLIEEVARRWPAVGHNPITWVLGHYSRYALGAFYFHLNFLYGFWGLRLTEPIHQSCGWIAYACGTLALIVATGIAAWGTSKTVRWAMDYWARWWTTRASAARSPVPTSPG
jgi:hypothetical protein